MKISVVSIIRILIFNTVAFLFFPAQSYIQLETGQLFHEMIDFEITNGNFPLIISRQYQQLKPANSILGDRWCFDFEQQMRAENGGYRLYSCGNPTPVFFSLKGKKLVFENEVMFEKKKGGLLRHAGKQITLIYNEKGFLIAKKKTGLKKAAIKISYDKENRPTKISYLDKYLLEIKLDSKGKATGIFSNKKKVVNYVVVNNKLTFEKNGWNLEHQFEYNSLGLLSQIKYPDNSTEKFSYTNDTKLIEDYVSKQGCVRKFEYQLDTAKSSAKISLKDSCVKEPPLQITLKRSNIFHKNRTEQTAQKKPRKNPSNLAISRDQYNRVQKLENSKISWTIGYNSRSGNLSTVTETIKSSKLSKTYKIVFKGNRIIEISEIGRSKINFVYSNNGRLLRVRSTARPEERLLMMAKVDQIRTIIEGSTL